MQRKITVAFNFIANHVIYYYRFFQSLYRKLYPEQHQLTSTTSRDRYPEVFTEAKGYASLLNISEVSILSFGCSTGEECISLKKYFDSARIVGADINKANISKAERINSAPNINYILSSPANIQNAGPFDVIFCMSVLCRWEETKYVDNCEKLYPFEKFEKTVEMLVSNLKVGGILVIYNSNFRFEDTQVFTARNFQILATPSVVDSGFVYKFTKKNERSKDVHKHCIYKKGN